MPLPKLDCKAFGPQILWMWLLAACPFLVTSLACTAVASAPSSIEVVAKHASPAVYTVLATRPFPSEPTQGTAFRVGGNAFATAAHVVDGATAIFLATASQTHVSEASIVTIDHSSDLALLQADQSLPESPVLDLFATTLSPGAPIVIIGSPSGMDNTLSIGIISALRESGGMQQYQLSVPISPGSSGSPVINNDGRVIGVLTAKLIGVEGAAFATPSLALQALIARPIANVPLPLEAKPEPGATSPVAPAPAALINFNPRPYLWPGHDLSLWYPVDWFALGEGQDTIEFLNKKDRRFSHSLQLSAEVAEIVDPWQFDQEYLLQGMREEAQALELSAKDFRKILVHTAKGIHLEAQATGHGVKLHLCVRIFYFGGHLYTAFALIDHNDPDWLAVRTALLAALDSITFASTQGSRDSEVHGNAKTKAQDAQVFAQEKAAADAYRAATAFTEALARGDYAKALSWLAPGLIESMGGRSSAITQLKATIDKATEWSSDVSAAGPVIFTGDVQVTTLRTYTTWKFGDADDQASGTAEGWLLAMSEDGGRSWHLMEGSQTLSLLLHELFGSSAATLEMPPRRMVVGGADSDFLLETIEVNGEMMPTPQSREHMLKLLQDYESNK